VVKRSYFDQVKVYREMQRTKSLMRARKHADELRLLNLSLKKQKTEMEVIELEEKKAGVKEEKEKTYR